MTHKIELPIPAFIQFGEFYYKIVNETMILTLCDYDFAKKIEYQELNQCNPFANWGWNLISEQKFNEVFIKIYSELEELLPKTTI